MTVPAAPLNRPDLRRRGAIRAFVIPCAAVFGIALAGAPRAAFGQAAVPLVPVVRGASPGVDAEVVVLCPDLGVRPEVFLARGRGGLAITLADAGYRVLLVDPWHSAAASDDGFDGVVADVFPDVLARVKAIAGAAPVTFVGHGLCGMLPVAAAATPRGIALTYRWIALGTRFDWRLLAPRFRDWLGAYAVEERPLPKITQATMFTGFRAGLGARAGSAPPTLSQEGRVEDVMYRLYDEGLHREAPRAVVEDLLRWSTSGAITSRQGWVDYGAGLLAVTGPALLIAGMADPMAPPEDVIAGVDRLRPRVDVQLRVLSRANGDHEEYGHLGMLLSRHAAWDVDRAILAFLRGRALP